MTTSWFGSKSNVTGANFSTQVVRMFIYFHALFLLLLFLFKESMKKLSNGNEKLMKKGITKQYVSCIMKLVERDRILRRRGIG